jgi:hypothetical protein
MQFLIAIAMRLIARDSLSCLSLRFIGVEIAFAPMHIAIAFKGKNMRGNAI